MRATSRKCLATALWLASLCVLSTALAQTPADLVGTWTLVASITERDGVRREQFGPKASGMMILDESGHFMLTIIGADLPTFASGNRAQATTEESKAVIARTIAMIGRYSVNDETLTFDVDASTFPNWAGTTQKRVIVVGTHNALEYVTPTASSGGVGSVRWSRLR